VAFIDSQFSATRRGLHRGPPTFADPVTANLTKTQFRWCRLCELTDSEMPWEQKRWCEAFALASEIRADLLAIEAPKDILKIVNDVIKPGFERRGICIRSIPT
jgi:hypothetical protein